MSKQDYVDYLKIWFPRNKAKGLISQILFEEEFESGFLKKHADKIYPGCWVVSPKSFDSNRYRYVISVHEKTLDHEPEEDEIDQLLGASDVKFYKIANFVSNASMGILYAVPYSDDGKIDFSRINADDFAAVQWSMFIFKQGSLKKINADDFFSNWRSGQRARKARDKWDDDPILTSKLLNMTEQKLESFVLKELFYTGFLKSTVKISTDDPYDVDCFIVSTQTENVFPLELKEKTPVYKKYRDGTTSIHYFGIDTGRVSMMERLCSPSDSNAFYVVREVDDTENRNLKSWKVMTLAGIVSASSWNSVAGGTGMFGGGTSTASLPYSEFEDLNESTFEESNLGKISKRSQSVKDITAKYELDRTDRENQTIN